MTSYGGLHAVHYDLVYADKPYADEARWVAETLARATDAAVPPGALLDVACGTGRHALMFAELGFKVTGVDYNPKLLECGRATTAAAGLSVDFVEADMRRLDLAERSFVAVTCLFDAIGYPLDDDGVVAALAGIARHLDAKGAAAVEFLHAPAVRSGYSPTRVRRRATPEGGELLRISETSLDDERRQMAVEYDIVELAPDGRWSRSRERQVNRFFDVDEMEGLLGRGGLAPTAFLPAYGSHGKVADDTFHVVAIARPA